MIVFCLESLGSRISGLQSNEDFSNRRTVSCVWTACCRAQQKFSNWMLSKMVYRSVNIKVTSKVTFSVLHITSFCAEISVIFYVGQQWISPWAAGVIIQQIGKNIHIDSLISRCKFAPNICLVNIQLNKFYISEESRRGITSSGNSLTHLKDCTFHSKMDIFLFSITVLLISVGVLRTKKVPNKYFLNRSVNEWKLCSAQCLVLFCFFLRSVSLLSTRRCGSWHCDRKGKGQRSRYWWKCTVILRHHWWRWNSALWNHFWCPGPGWHYKAKKGKLRKILFIFQRRLWNLSFEVDRGWADFLT